MELKIYEFPDICVACGAPAAPGEQICWACQQIANDPRESLPDMQSREKKKLSFREILKIALFEEPVRR